MIGRVLVMAGGLVGAAGLSQFPEFSQQYVQRLGGAVDELTVVVEQFDRDAAGLGLGRNEMLVQMAGEGQAGQIRARSMAAHADRLDRLTADLEALDAAGPFTRARQAVRMRDRDVATRALEEFKPALPFTFEGGTFAGVGFLIGLTLLSLAIWILRMPFRLYRSRVS